MKTTSGRRKLDPAMLKRQKPRNLLDRSLSALEYPKIGEEEQPLATSLLSVSNKDLLWSSQVSLDKKLTHIRQDTPPILPTDKSLIEINSEQKQSRAKLRAYTSNQSSKP